MLRFYIAHVRRRIAKLKLQGESDIINQTLMETAFLRCFSFEGKQSKILLSPFD